MGLFSSKKKTSSQTKLICNPEDIGSYKCIFIASYRKLPVEISWEKSSAEDDKLSASLHMVGLNRYPCVEDGDFTVCGTNAVMTYLNIKGTTPTIHPRKARVLAAQNYWIQVLLTKLEPLLTDTKSNSEQISNILESLDKSLDSNNYIVGEFSLADIHWSAVFRYLEDQDQGSIFSSYANITSWLSKMKTEIPAYDTKAEKIAA
ncbi:MAG: glutathione binding-like protein [Gammaproteobacteria bacterium]